MPVPAKAFQRWLQGVAPSASMADISRISGVKRTTLAQQLVRGKVAESTVVSISRAFGVNPVTALAFFDTFISLRIEQPPPRPEELVSQIATTDLLHAVIARSIPDDPGVPPVPQPPLIPAPHATSVKNWVDAIDDGELRHRVSAATGIAPQNYSAQLTANRLTPELAIATAVAAGVAPTSGLVATGLISEEEAGWAPEARQRALAGLSDGELASMAGERLQAIGRTLRRQELDHERTEKIWENLG